MPLTMLRPGSALTWQSSDGTVQHAHGCEHETAVEIRECPDESWTGCQSPVRITSCSLDGARISVTTLDGHPHQHRPTAVRW